MKACCKCASLVMIGAVMGVLYEKYNATMKSLMIELMNKCKKEIDNLED